VHASAATHLLMDGIPHSWIQRWKAYQNWSTFVKVIAKINMTFCSSVVVNDQFSVSLQLLLYAVEHVNNVRTCVSDDVNTLADKRQASCSFIAGVAQLQQQAIRWHSWVSTVDRAHCLTQLLSRLRLHHAYVTEVRHCCHAVRLSLYFLRSTLILWVEWFPWTYYKQPFSFKLTAYQIHQTATWVEGHEISRPPCFVI